MEETNDSCQTNPEIVYEECQNPLKVYHVVLAFFVALVLGIVIGFDCTTPVSGEQQLKNSQIQLQTAQSKMATDNMNRAFNLQEQVAKDCMASKGTTEFLGGNVTCRK